MWSRLLDKRLNKTTARLVPTDASSRVHCYEVIESPWAKEVPVVAQVIYDGSGNSQVLCRVYHFYSIA